MGGTPPDLYRLCYDRLTNEFSDMTEYMEKIRDKAKEKEEPQIEQAAFNALKAMNKAIQKMAKLETIVTENRKKLKDKE